MCLADMKAEVLTVACQPSGGSIPTSAVFSHTKTMIGPMMTRETSNILAAIYQQKSPEKNWLRKNLR